MCIGVDVSGATRDARAQLGRPPRPPSRAHAHERSLVQAVACGTLLYHTACLPRGVLVWLRGMAACVLGKRGC